MSEISSDSQDVADQAVDAAQDAAQAVAEQGGFWDLALYWLDRITEPIIALLSEPVLWHAILAMLGGAILSVLITEWLKRFAPILTWLFEGEHAVLKMRLAAALIGGALAVLIGPDGFKLSLIVFIAAAAASPSCYDVSYRLAPVLTERVLKRVRG